MSAAIDLGETEHLKWVRWHLEQFQSARALRELPPRDLEWYEQLLEYETSLLRRTDGAARQ